MASSPASLHFGEAEVRRIVDIGMEAFAVSDIFPAATDDFVRTQHAAGVQGLRLGDAPQVELSFYGNVVRLGGKVLLIDTCCGHEKNRPARPGWHMRKTGPFLENLAAAGLTPADVDYVMCTHLHADHVGWNTRMENGAWAPTFPNAEYVFGEDEYRFWSAEYEAGDPENVLYGAYKDSILPVIASGQAKLATPGHSPCAGVHLEAARGHTPGNSAIHVESAGASMTFLGDVLHHKMQVADPDLNTRFCWSAEEARATRRRALEEAARSGAFVAGGHFMGEAYGKIARDGAVYRFEGVA